MANSRGSMLLLALVLIISRTCICAQTVLPNCAKYCLSTIIASSGCGILDSTCICHSNAITIFGCCLSTTCDDEDRLDGLNAFETICRFGGISKLAVPAYCNSSLSTSTLISTSTLTTPSLFRPLATTVPVRTVTITVSSVELITSTIRFSIDLTVSFTARSIISSKTTSMSISSVSNNSSVTQAPASTRVPNEPRGGSKAGIAAGVSAGLIIMIAAIILFLRRKNENPFNPPEENVGQGGVPDPNIPENS